MLSAFLAKIVVTENHAVNFNAKKVHANANSMTNVKVMLCAAEENVFQKVRSANVTHS